MQSDYAYTLKSENDLLNQDIKTLEEQLSKSKEERDNILTRVMNVLVDTEGNKLVLSRAKLKLS